MPHYCLQIMDDPEISITVAEGWTLHGNLVSSAKLYLVGPAKEVFRILVRTPKGVAIKTKTATAARNADGDFILINSEGKFGEGLFTFPSDPFDSEKNEIFRIWNGRRWVSVIYGKNPDANTRELAVEPD